jgi:hypothetical protein
VKILAVTARPVGQLGEKRCRRAIILIVPSCSCRMSGSRDILTEYNLFRRIMLQNLLVDPIIPLPGTSANSGASPIQDVNIYPVQHQELK